MAGSRGKPLELDLGVGIEALPRRGPVYTATRKHLTGAGVHPALAALARNQAALIDYATTRRELWHADNLGRGLVEMLKLIDGPAAGVDDVAAAIAALDAPGGQITTLT